MTRFWNALIALAKWEIFGLCMFALGCLFEAILIVGGKATELLLQRLVG